MGLGNIFVIVFLIFYLKYLYKLIFDKGHRQNIISANIRMTQLRKIAIKSVKQQKEFVELRHPRFIKGYFKITHKNTTTFIFMIVKMIIFFQIFIYLFDVLHIDFRVWQALVLMMVAPLLMNIPLRRFGVHKSDITNMFGGK